MDMNTIKRLWESLNNLPEGISLLAQFGYRGSRGLSHLKIHELIYGNGQEEPVRPLTPTCRTTKRLVLRLCLRSIDPLVSPTRKSNKSARGNCYWTRRSGPSCEQLSTNLSRQIMNRLPWNWNVSAKAVQTILPTAQFKALVLIKYQPF